MFIKRDCIVPHCSIALLQHHSRAMHNFPLLLVIALSYFPVADLSDPEIKDLLETLVVANSDDSGNAPHLQYVNISPSPSSSLHRRIFGGRQTRIIKFCFNVPHPHHIWEFWPLNLICKHVVPLSVHISAKETIEGVSGPIVHINVTAQNIGKSPILVFTGNSP